VTQADAIRDPRTRAREYAVQFLYQCESEKLFHFSENHYRSFVEHLQVPGTVAALVRELAQGTLSRAGEIDGKIQEVSTNWKLSRMSVVDRNVLRLATFELITATAPVKVVLNEAVELAKKFGADDSGRFVNGILDRLAGLAKAAEPG
jgi:N utilization substance protein B